MNLSLNKKSFIKLSSELVWDFCLESIFTLCSAANNSFCHRYIISMDIVFEHGSNHGRPELIFCAGSYRGYKVTVTMTMSCQEDDTIQCFSFISSSYTLSVSISAVFPKPQSRWNKCIKSADNTTITFQKHID